MERAHRETLLLHDMRYLPVHRKRSMPDHYGINVKCLDDFDWRTVPVRAAQGQNMPIVDADARDIWPGQRT